MGRTIKTSFCSRVTFSRRSPVAMSNGCAPVLASYSAITLFTSSMSAVARSYSRSVVSPWDENVSILAFMFGLLRDVHVWSTVGSEAEGLGPWMSYCTVSDGCQDDIPRCKEDSRRVSSAQMLVVQEIRIGVSCFSRIDESKMNGICSSRHMDCGKNPHGPLAQWAVQCFRE